ncbi:MAG: diguanylate cyclase [Thermoleophilaceae bacterium]|jgi:EAL domain-containing protein (putative c-di-GMP-specific phosphodiesterase class I)|nr:diguanylate cyclase [Thermoleophilaceae bacterium]
MRVLVALATVGLLMLVTVIAMVLTGGLDGYTQRTANERARLGADLLVNVGRKMPNLTSAVVARGLSQAAGSQLDRAVSRGRRDGLLSDVTVWDLSGAVVYSADNRLEGTRPRIEPEVARGLRGEDLVVPHALGLDQSTGLRTGVLDAVEPLRDDLHRVYGAIEVGLPLRPVSASAAQERDRMLTYLIVGAAILWLTLLPLTWRAARGVALQWVTGRRRTLRAFRRGLTNGEVELAYQPQVDTRDGSVHAVEALVRWRRRGRLETPAYFLAHVESSPLIADLTERVLDLALGQLAAWRAAGRRFRISVNLSAANLSDHAAAAKIAAALARHAVPANALTIEITETAVLGDPAVAHQVVGDIAALDVELALDDFGTGTASLARLYELPITELKIDRSFVGPTDERPRAYLRAIISFAHGLGLRVVAEGVEDAATLAFLRHSGCDLAQGYHLARPLDAAALETWLSEHPAALPEPTLAPADATDRLGV